MDAWLRILTVVGALTTGLMAGLYFAVSTAVMPARRQPRHSRS
jgi:uncharacterized membrane protein